MDMNAEFRKKISQLNKQQLAAVQQIDGPVMVVAGPGTGKTQLLTMRVANILSMTDIMPSNILCLTFTEAAATNMTERLATIIGQDAYKVEINTFHGFGSSIIGRYNEYFYNGANYQPADELTQSEIIQDILDKLPYNNPLRTRNKDFYSYLGDLKKCIGDFKKAALSSNELRQLLQQNLEFCDFITSHLNQVFSTRLSVKSLGPLYPLVSLANEFANSQDKLSFSDEPLLATMFADSLDTALTEATSNGEKPTTKPVSAWKKKWCIKHDVDGTVKTILNDQIRSEKLLLATDIYEAYLAEMDRRNLYDFNDMIIQVIDAIHNNADLKANLQEQYQYILVDEFQDTNDAQMRLLSELTDYDDTPNLMVVGDDDQAIYRFQGADISNIQMFAKKFPTITQINLCNNYRSGEAILQVSQAVSRDIQNRLTNLDGSSKQLLAQRNYQTQLSYIEATTEAQEFDYIASNVNNRISAGEKPGDIAIIARKHASLERLIPYLHSYGISASYERQQDIMRSPLIQLLIELAKLIRAIDTGNSSELNQHLPLVFADRAFGLSRDDYYKLSLNCCGQGKKWLDMLEANPKFTSCIIWLKELARRSATEPINKLLIDMVGITTVELSDNADIADTANHDSATGYRSPIYNYYFNQQRLDSNPYLYLSLLSDLNTLLNRLHQYRPDEELKLADMIHFIDATNDLGIHLYSNNTFGDDNSVHLLSAHKSKGLEFNTVYVIDAESEQWGSKSRNRANILSYPTNMPYGTIVGSDDDERRRLLYVAMTRAEKNLIITSHTIKDNGSELNQLEYLLEFPNRHQLAEPTVTEAIQQLETSLLERIIKPDSNQKELLADTLANYKLSATALNTFTDLMNSGPTQFLLTQLLHIPQGTSPALVLGNAVHNTMNQYITSLRQGNPLTIEQTITKFCKNYDDYSWQLSEADAIANRDKGIHALTTYLKQRADEFNGDTLTEYPLKATLPDGVKLTGKIDCLYVDKQSKTIRVLDFKTGKGLSSLDEKGSDNTKAKAHRYSQQLMFYKLLVEHSPEFSGYTVTSGVLDFIEPDVNGNLHRAEVDYSDTQAMTDFAKLITAVWNRIINLDLPDTSSYEANFKSILEFENYLINN